MTTLRWLTNMENPDEPNHRAEQRSNESGLEATARERHWLQGKIIGEPKETPHCTVEQLNRWNMVGIYVEERG